MEFGYGRPLYILRFDHHARCQRGLSGFHPPNQQGFVTRAPAEKSGQAIAGRYAGWIQAFTAHSSEEP